jgi:nucleoside-diphosphate kinase
MERALLILKPDAIQRRLVGKIIGRFEDKGFRILAMKMTKLDEQVIRNHYGEHEGKVFYEPLVQYMSANPVILLAVEAKGGIAIARAMMGKTFGCDAAPGTIRGDYAVSNRFNLIHGSDSPEAAAKEIGLFFKPEELCEIDDCQEGWIYDLSTGERV